MNSKIWITAIVLIYSIYSCTNGRDLAHNVSVASKVSVIGYNLSDPDKTNILPYSLREISGLTVIDSSSVACVQDEKGIVFLYDLESEQVTKQIYFNADGDFEGICRVGQTLYVLKSNGMLYKISNYETSSIGDEINFSSVNAADIEGLCFDRDNNRLLIAPKSKSGKNLTIYGFDLASGEQVKEPVYNIRPLEMGISEPVKTKKVKKKKKAPETEVNLRPSEIAIHPLTGKLFLLSAEQHMLYVFDNNGMVEYSEKLDPFILNQPEGLAFFENGDMLISNEAGDKYPSILRFNYRK